MKTLDIEALTVESFDTSSDPFASLPAFDDPGFATPPVSEGVECGQSLYVTCSCQCHTVRYDCV
jgi:hypothetical protein